VAIGELGHLRELHVLEIGSVLEIFTIGTTICQVRIFDLSESWTFKWLESHKSMKVWYDKHSMSLIHAMKCLSFG
jgi:hypothetical protein